MLNNEREIIHAYYLMLGTCLFFFLHVLYLYRISCFKSSFFFCSRRILRPFTRTRSGWRRLRRASTVAYASRHSTRRDSSAEVSPGWGCGWGVIRIAELLMSGNRRSRVTGLVQRWEQWSNYTGFQHCWEASADQIWSLTWLNPRRRVWS